MPSRRRSRECALQILYSWDMREQASVNSALRAFFDTLQSDDETGEAIKDDSFTTQLVEGTVAAIAAIDEQITKHAAHWRIERMPAVDRNILRLAVFEITLSATPPAVVIDEALELARKFSGEESVQFVNGVLDAISKQFKQRSTDAT